MNKIQTSTLPHALEQQDSQFACAFALIGAAIRERVTPGAVIAVTYREQLVAWKAFGRFTYEEDGTSVQPPTVFDLASVTKVVATTSMAMLLHERGKLDLKTKVRDFFRQFHDAEKQEVSIGMLLSHCSGLAPYEKLFLRCKRRNELIAATAASPLAYSPGTRSEYSDMGFILLGEILVRVAGEDPAAFFAREIAAPLQMTSAQFSPEQSLRNAIPPTQEDREFRHRVIQGEVDDENASVMGGVAGHAGLFASAHDLALFSECLLHGGAPILQPETVRLFTTRRSWPTCTSFALGWDTPSQPSQSGSKLSANSFGHLGFTGTSLWIDPERRLSITLLTNRTWPDRQSQAIKQLRPAVHDAIVEAL
jgi:CubicO group peptidase (beta-lactamase class C family)